MTNVRIENAIYRHAAERPDATALRFGGGAISYRALCDAADSIAAKLIPLGVGVGDIVPVVLHRCPEFVATLIGILRTGAAYSAFDPGWSPRRVESLLQVMRPKILVSDHFEHSLAWQPGSFDIHSLASEPHSPLPAQRGQSEDVAAVFFSSGTTGEPKGVLSPHAGTTRLFLPCPFARLTRTSVMPQNVALPWDVLGLELWGVLVNGGCSALIGGDEPMLPSTLREAISRDHANILWLTTTLFNMFVDEDPRSFAGLDHVLIGGERVSPAHVRKFLECHPRIRLTNCYGPAEATIFASTHEIDLADCSRPEGIPIGRPAPGTDIFVLTDDDKPTNSEPGEICIGGDGLAHGYLMDPALTEARFVSRNIDGVTHRLYRTGDIGFWRDGRLYYSGRRDRQVKVRGHRVEPSALERVIMAVPQVRQCAVVAQAEAGRETRLIAFYCTDDGEPLNEDNAAVLRADLPDYLLPHRFVHVDALPVTRAGKLNEHALISQLAEREHTYIPASQDGPLPDRPLQQIVRDAFHDLLERVDAISPDMSFFSLGGSSLDAARICARLKSRTGIALPISRFMAQPTVAGIAEWITEHAGTYQTEPQPGQPAGKAGPMSPAQTGLWLEQVRAPADLSRLCFAAWWLTGAVDYAALDAAIGDVHRRHELLHSRFVLDGDPVVVPDRGIPPPRLLRLPAAGPADDAMARVLRALSQPLDIVSGEVWRACAIRAEEPAAELFCVVVHHIAFDAASEEILARELSAAYAARLSGRKPSYASVPPSWMAVLNTYRSQVDKGTLASQRASWKAELADVPELILPVGEVSGTGLGVADLMLDAVKIRPWIDAARQVGATRFTALAAYVATRVAAQSGQSDFAFGVPVTRRCSAFFDNTIGCLIDSICVRVTFGDGRVSLLSAVTEVERGLRRGLAAQDIPLREVIGLVRPKRSVRHPLFQIMFAPRDLGDPALSLPGCQSEFVRPDPPRAVAEMVFETVPCATSGDVLLHVTYQRDAVSPDFVKDLLADM